MTRPILVGFPVDYVLKSGGSGLPMEAVDPASIASVSALVAAGTGSPVDQANNATAIGAINAATGLSVSIQRVGKDFTLTFTLAAVSITVTDAAGAGASGSLKIFDFVTAAVIPTGCLQNYTAFAEGAALTGGAGDAAFVMGLGSVAADAGDGVLTATEVDIGSVTGTITLVAGTATARKANGALAVVGDGSTAVDLYLNWCGTAATIDANSTISVTGTITVTGIILP